jgi:myo-inositol-1(or 4)-monophosphatase
MSSDIAEYKVVLEDLLQQAARISTDLFGKVGTLYTKTSASDVVTEADIKINELAISTLQQRFPDHGILTEEKPATTGNEYTWIIDPLDGTFNFTRATPLFGTMIALARNDKIILGGTTLPMFQETYIAWQGGGAWKNGQRISCSTQSELKESYGCGYASLDKKRVPIMQRVLDFAKNNRIWASSFGSAAMSGAYMSDGRRDCYHSSGGGVWDYAASSIIMSEAGCKVTDLEGKPWTPDAKHIVSANPVLHPEFLRLVRGSS